MAHIEIHRPHNLDQNQARASAERIAADLHQEFDISYHWEDDTLHFQRTGVSGRIVLEDAAVGVEVQLGMLLLPMRDQFRREIDRHLDDVFGPTST